MGKAAFLILLLVGVFVFLYHRGWMIVQSKSAVSFVGSRGGNSARFVSCNGYIKRIVRFKADGTYTYLLDVDLSKGDLSVELSEPDGHKLMELNRANRSASVTVERKKRYILVIRFKSATGRYALIRE